MRVSLMSYTFNPMTRAGTMDCFGYLETARYRYGLRTADLWNRTLASIEPEYLAQVKAGLLERELELVNLAVDAARNILAVFEGRMPDGLVNPDVLKTTTRVKIG